MSKNSQLGFNVVPSAREIEWRRTLERWKKSGLSGRAFCGREGLPEPSFYGWKRRLRILDEREAVPRRRRPARRRKVSVGPAANVRLLPVRVAAPVAAFELTLGDGRTLRIPANFHADALARLLEILVGKPC